MGVYYKGCIVQVVSNCRGCLVQGMSIAGYVYCRWCLLYGCLLQGFSSAGGVYYRWCLLYGCLLQGLSSAGGV